MSNGTIINGDEQEDLSFNTSRTCAVIEDDFHRLNREIYGDDTDWHAVASIIDEIQEHAEALRRCIRGPFTEDIDLRMRAVAAATYALTYLNIVASHPQAPDDIAERCRTQSIEARKRAILVFQMTIHDMSRDRISL